MYKAEIKYICGINGDRVAIIISDKNGLPIANEEYSYGYNASYNRDSEAYAKKNYEDAIKYGWKSCYYCLKPYIGDLLVEFLSKYGLTKEDAKYSAYYVFSQRYANESELNLIVESLYKEL